MEKVTKQEFYDKLNKNKEKEVNVDFKGIITTNIKIKSFEYFITENYIEIYDKENIDINVKLNTHQIMNIIKKMENQYIIEFDGMQCAYIILGI